LTDSHEVFFQFGTMPSAKQFDVAEKSIIMALFREGVAAKEIANMWRAGYAPADRQTSWGVLHPY
jgi:hypothetical protein